MTKLATLLSRHWLWMALAVSLGLLATVHAMQRFGGLTPCALCLDQRKVYWVAAAIAAVGIAARFTPLGRRLDRVFAALLLATFLVGVFIAGRHAGIELGWLPPLETCGAGGPVDLKAMSDLATGANKVKAVPCDVVQWSFIGLSMAGWNALVSVLLAAASAIAAITRPRLEPAA